MSVTNERVPLTTAINTLYLTQIISLLSQTTMSEVKNDLSHVTDNKSTINGMKSRYFAALFQRVSGQTLSEGVFLMN